MSHRNPKTMAPKEPSAASNDPELAPEGASGTEQSLNKAPSPGEAGAGPLDDANVPNDTPGAPRAGRGSVGRRDTLNPAGLDTPAPVGRVPTVPRGGPRVPSSIETDPEVASQNPQKKRGLVQKLRRPSPRAGKWMLLLGLLLIALAIGLFILNGIIEKGRHKRYFQVVFGVRGIDANCPKGTTCSERFAMVVPTQDHSINEPALIKLNCSIDNVETAPQTFLFSPQGDDRDDHFDSATRNITIIPGNYCNSDEVFANKGREVASYSMYKSLWIQHKDQRMNVTDCNFLNDQDSILWPADNLSTYINETRAAQNEVLAASTYVTPKVCTFEV